MTMKTRLRKLEEYFRENYCTFNRLIEELFVFIYKNNNPRPDSYNDDLVMSFALACG